MITAQDIEAMLPATVSRISSMERIRIRKHIITGEQTVTEGVRKEMIETHLTDQHDS